MSVRRRGVLLGAAAAFVAPGDVGVTLAVPEGRILAVLFARQAPLSAGDFLRHVDRGDYDGGRFTRTVRADNDHGRTRIDVIQGEIRPGVAAGPGIAHETTRRTGLRHLDGTLSLPRDAPGTGSGAGFFICIGDQPSLDFGGKRNPDGQGFAAFGRVVSGLEIVRAIWRMDASGVSPDRYTAGQMLRVPVPILSARRS